MYKLGIDLGGTKIEGIVLDAQGNELIRERIDTERDKGYGHIMDRLTWMYNRLASDIDNAPHTFGIGTPGAISYKTGLLKNSNTTCMNGKPFIKDMEAKIGRPVGVANDANCFAMAEAMAGAGKGFGVVFGVIMGTGCGGGIVINEKVHNGIQSIAGEWGHMTIDPFNGPVSYTGKRGTVEEYISGTGLETRYFERYGERIKLKEVVSRYRRHEVRETEFMEDFFEKFGICMANLINILDPDIIVMGGGVSNIDEIYTKGIEQVRRYVFNDELETPIVRNVCGDSAGVIGAAYIGV